MSAQASSAVVAASLEAVTTGGSLTGLNLTACFLVGCLCSGRGRCSSGCSRRAVVCHGVTLSCDSLDFAWFSRFCLNFAVQFLATSFDRPSRGSELSCRRTCRAVPSTLGALVFHCGCRSFKHLCRKPVPLGLWTMPALPLLFQLTGPSPRLLG